MSMQEVNVVELLVKSTVDSVIRNFNLIHLDKLKELIEFDINSLTTNQKPLLILDLES